MTKTYIIYNEISVESELVDCIYLNGGECRAQPFIAKMPGRMGEELNFFKPIEDDQNRYCKKTEGFQFCPRFKAYQEHLRAIGFQK